MNIQFECNENSTFRCLAYTFVVCCHQIDRKTYILQYAKHYSYIGLGILYVEFDLVVEIHFVWIQFVFALVKIDCRIQ